MHFLVLQATYESIELGIFSTSTRTAIHTAFLPKQESMRMIQTVDALLHAARLQITDLSFYVVNKGPTPFTTLRSVIATLNGINAITRKPIVEIENLTALWHEHQDAGAQKIIILNAFAQEYYYATDQEKGVCKLLFLYESIKKQSITHLIGNGAPLFVAALAQQELHDSFSIVNPEQGTPSLLTLAKIGMTQFVQSTPDFFPRYSTAHYLKHPMIFQ